MINNDEAGKVRHDVTHSIFLRKLLSMQGVGFEQMVFKL